MTTNAPIEHATQRDFDIEKNDPTQQSFPNEKHAHQNHDIEKQSHDTVARDVNGFPDDSSKEGFETGSTHKQEGVKKVEALTTVWSNKSLWIMFAL